MSSKNVIVAIASLLFAGTLSALQLPPDITVEANGPAGSTVTYSVAPGGSTGDDHNGRPNSGVSCAPASGSIFPLGRTTVTCHNTNQESGTFVVIVTDTTAPTLRLSGSLIESATSPAGAIVRFDAAATDVVDGSIAVACSPSSGSLFAVGTTQVHCSATDQHGNSTAGTFSVTVTPYVAPPPPPPPASEDIVAEATGPNGAVVTYNASGGSGDDENGRPSTTCNPPSGSTFPIGQTTVQCADGSSFTVTVVDTKAPELQLPGGITREATGAGGAEVVFTATATDLVDGSPLVTCTPPSGSLFALGTTVVACTASDAAGNTANGTFSVTVSEEPAGGNDTEAPAFVSISASPDVLWPPNKGFEVVTVNAQVLDNADPAPLVRIYAVTANETISAEDWRITGPLIVELRRDRDPHGSGRVYTLHVEAIDAAGNRAVTTVTVKVPHDNGNTAPAATTPDPPRRRGART